MTSYSVISQIGQGSSSRVLLATRKEEIFVHLGPGSKFKVKGHLMSSSERTLNKKKEENKYVVIKERKYSKEAIHEARLLKALCVHPFVVRFEDAFVIRKINRICLVMERAEQDLKQVLAKYVKFNQFVSHSLTTRWIAQIALAVDHLHAHGIVHRDIKPANLLLLNDGRLVLGDLGTAKQMNKFEHEFGCKTLHGTPLYLAPEVFNGCAYGTKADIWSIGCVAYEIITSGRVKAFDAKNMHELKRQVQRGFQYTSISHNMMKANADYNEGTRLSRDENRVNDILITRQVLLNNFVNPCLQTDPKIRIGIESLIRLPFFVRAIGALMADWKHGEFHLSKNRADCLIKQLDALGLTETCKAGMQLAGFQKRMNKRYHPDHGSMLGK